MKFAIVVTSLLISTLTFAGILTEEQVTNLIASSPKKSALARTVIFSRNFLGIPYKFDNLGEGDKGTYDQDPLYRFNLFDCTTFVETITAMALAHDFDSFKNFMNRIRYESGHISYVLRNHFPELDWIPNNIEAGFLSDITYEVAQDAPVAISKAINDKQNFYAKKRIEELNVPGKSQIEHEQLLAQWHNEGRVLKAEAVQLPYIPIREIISKHRDVLSRIPSGAIINIVREGWEIRDSIDNSLITQQIVSHQAFAIRRNGTLYFRHASSDLHQVGDVKASEYLTRYLHHATIRGIHVMRVIDGQRRRHQSLSDLIHWHAQTF